MRVEFSEKVQSKYNILPVAISKAFRKQVEFLKSNLRHPSLHAKKYDQASDVWQARINNDWRFYFLIKND